MKRHLIIAGMQRSGTTWLYDILRQHPLIVPTQPARREPKYFLSDENAGGGYDGYLRLFPQADVQYQGWLAEKSTSYSEFPSVPERIIRNLPRTAEVRIVFIMRHPIERAKSNIRFSQRFELEDRSVIKALEDSLSGPVRPLGIKGVSTSVDPKAYLERGLYWQQIEPYIRVFGIEKVKLLISEDTLANATAIMNLLEWLDLETHALPANFADRVNQSTECGVTQDRLPQVLYRKLQEYYRLPNLDLASNARLNLSAWAEADRMHCGA